MSPNTSGHLPAKPTDEGAFSLLLSYRDIGHRRLARNYCDGLLERLQWHWHVNISEWKFEMLASSELREMAAAEAGEARLVVLATLWAEPLPGAVAEWLSIWPAARTSTPRVLTAILSETPRFVQAQPPNYSILQEYVERSATELVIYATPQCPDENKTFNWMDAQRMTAAGLTSTEVLPEIAAFSRGKEPGPRRKISRAR